MMRVGWLVAIGAALLPAFVPVARAAPQVNVIPAAQRLYREGVLADGSALRGLRQGDNPIEGGAAACINCHRRSGLGNVEGRTRVPPITAKYLFRPRAVNAADMDTPHLADFQGNSWAYSNDSLARALREGLKPDGQALSPLMPRYDLPDTDMTGLIAYLRQLGEAQSPGVSETELQFATIITPEADPVSSAAMLEVLRKFFALESQQIAAETRPMKASREIQYRVTRRWNLHVWQLTGPVGTWQSQLDAYLTAEPVFAVLAGISGRHWEPIHRFCEQRQVPCLFPNVDAPVLAEGDFYPIYYSRGVYLEADLALHQLQQDPSAGQERRRRLVQVFRAADVGADGASALGAKAAAAGWLPVSLSLANGSSASLVDALKQVREDDALMLWLRPGDLQNLPSRPPTRSVMVSGTLGGMEAAPIPPAWRELAVETYPIDLPNLRLARMNYPLFWFKVQNIKVVDERTQVNTYLSCVILADILKHMLDSFVPDYLVERYEAMISLRLANAYYPRLGLAPGQRFASKGGYLVRWQGAGVVPQGEWYVPGTEGGVP
jgi:hypothetical protein